jgi:hypothetical protein
LYFQRIALINILMSKLSSLHNNGSRGGVGEMTNVVVLAPTKRMVKDHKSKKTPSHFVPSPTI